MEKASMNNTRLNILLSPGFLVGLTLLLLNDHILKAFSYNWITGKLSDFAGLFIFPLFLIALFPKSKTTIYVMTALCFALWKSPCSGPLINAWNAIAPISIGRTVDYGDLIALLVLPLSNLYAGRVPQAATKRIATGLVCVISIFAFTATSFRKEESFTYTNSYAFEGTKTDLIRRLERLHSIEYLGRSLAPEAEPDTFEINFDSCTDTAIINIKAEKGQSVITLNKIIWRCPNGERQEMLQFFEKEFINKLRDEEPKPSSTIQWIRLVVSTKT
jgi:hypothetical protein